MNDEELIAQLREAKNTQDLRYTLEDAAADRLEALIVDRDAYKGFSNRWEGHYRDRARMLSKAVGVLREIVNRWDTPSWKDAEPTADVINRARAVLTELETPE